MEIDEGGVRGEMLPSVALRLAEQGRDGLSGVCSRQRGLRSSGDADRDA